MQQRFYDFGFGIMQIDGRLSNETVQGLIAFQKWAGLPETGQLTRLTLQKIDATEAPTAWAALVFDGLGNHSMVTGDTRRATEADAVSAFRKKWRSDFNVASVPRAALRRHLDDTLQDAAEDFHPGIHQHG